MNCQEVDKLITDLARNEALDNEASQDALAHLKECQACGRRLEAERSLTEGLLAWAATSAGEQAPPRVEERLREAFRQRSAPAAAPVRLGSRSFAIAAAGSIAAGIVLFKLLAPSPATAPVAPPPPVRIASVPP